MLWGVDSVLVMILPRGVCITKLISHAAGEMKRGHWRRPRRLRPQCMAPLSRSLSPAACKMPCLYYMYAHMYINTCVYTYSGSGMYIRIYIYSRGVLQCAGCCSMYASDVPQRSRWFKLPGRASIRGIKLPPYEKVPECAALTLLAYIEQRTHQATGLPE